MYAHCMFILLHTFDSRLTKQTTSRQLINEKVGITYYHWANETY